MGKEYLHKSIEITNPRPANEWARSKKGYVIDYNSMSRVYMVRIPDNNGSYKFVRMSEDEFSTENMITEDVIKRTVIDPVLKIDEPENDPVNHPSHYTDGKFEVIDFIEDHCFYRSFCLANAVKYISRAGKKDPASKKQDLEKAVWYMNRYIQTNDGLDSIFVPGMERQHIRIPTEEYIQDKGLEGTLSGLALEILDTGSVLPAIHALEIEIRQMQ